MIDDVVSYTLFESVVNYAMDGLPNSHSTPAKAQRVVNHNHAF